MTAGPETNAQERLRPDARKGEWLTAPAALVVLCLLYALPPPLVSGEWEHLRLPAEPLILGAILILLPPRYARWIYPPALIVAVLASLLQVFELATRLLLGRPSNILLDLALLPKLAELVQGAVGTGRAALLLLACGLLFIGLLLALRWALSSLAKTTAPAPALLLLGSAVAALHLPQGQPVASSELSLTLADQTARSIRMLDERASFGTIAADDPLAAQPPHKVLSSLGDADLLVVFIESYGRAAHSDPRYAARTSRALDEMQQAVESRGFTSLSGWSRSPTFGGQSWLAHATFMSGLWLSNQIRYDVALSTGRRFLPHFLHDTGRKSVLVMPAIVRPWPEAELMGFDRTLFARDLEYAGRPFNWVTMPDQYTLYAFERRVRAAESSPLFGFLALISSHAPWTPIAPVLADWDSIADGEIFSQWADEGDPPDVLWRDPERVREHYGRSIDYVLRTLTSYLQWMGDRPFLMIVLGDHEAGTIVSGTEASRDVPVHIISSEPELLEPFANWGYRSGVRPAPEGAVMPMDAFRDFLLEAYAGSAAETAARP